jgi:hypothetical protein
VHDQPWCVFSLQTANGRALHFVSEGAAQAREAFHSLQATILLGDQKGSQSLARSSANIRLSTEVQSAAAALKRKSDAVEAAKHRGAVLWACARLRLTHLGQLQRLGTASALARVLRQVAGSQVRVEFEVATNLRVLRRNRRMTHMSMSRLDIENLFMQATVSSTTLGNAC